MLDIHNSFFVLNAVCESFKLGMSFLGNLAAQSLGRIPK